MRILLFILVLLTTSFSSASAEKLFGSWEGGDTASMGIYGVMKITNKNITWGDCKIEYEIKKEEPGVEFRNQTNKKFLTGEIETYFLQIKGGNCAKNLSAFRLTFDLPEYSTYLAMIEYSKDGRPTGYMHFHKKSQ